MTDQSFTILIAAIGLVIGSIATYFINRFQSSQKRMHFFVKDFDVISQNLLNQQRDIEIRFHKLLVDELRITRFWLWNSGDVAIRGNEVSSGDKLRLEVPRADHISILEVQQSGKRVNVACELKAQSLMIEFDTIDEGDFVTGRIVYSVGSDADARSDDGPSVYGSIAGLPRGIQPLDLEEHYKESHWSGWLFSGAMVLMSIGFLVSIYFAFEVRQIMSEMGIDAGWLGLGLPYFMSFVGLILVSVSTWYIWSWRRVVSIRVPPGIRKSLRK